MKINMSPNKWKIVCFKNSQDIKLISEQIISYTKYISPSHQKAGKVYQVCKLLTIMKIFFIPTKDQHGHKPQRFGLNKT